MCKSVFHHDKTREKRKILLLHGQLITMPGASCHCQHTMMKSSRIMEERGSLMFRTHGERQKGRLKSCRMDFQTAFLHHTI